MKTVSDKKKIPLPQIRISDCISYTIVPQDVIDPPIPFSNPNPGNEIPFVPCKAPSQNKTSGTIGKKELTPVEEVEEYLKMEAAKEKPQNPQNDLPCCFSLSSLFITKSPIPENLNEKSVANICVHFPLALSCVYFFLFIS